MSYAEEALDSALTARALLTPPGGISPVSDEQRIALATAHALTAFALAALSQPPPP